MKTVVLILMMFLSSGCSDGGDSKTSTPELIQPPPPEPPPYENIQPVITLKSDEIKQVCKSYAVVWADNDPDDDALISLYYDIDNTGADGILIASEISENSIEDFYIWDVSSIPPAEYYIYAVIDDKTNTPVTVYSDFPVSVLPKSLMSKFTASDGVQDDKFGYSVSMSGDYAVIGAYGKASTKGAAYIFRRFENYWVQEKRLTASDGGTYDNFGYAVSISGDYAVIGAYGDDDNGYDTGAAYIFKRDGTNWIQESKLTASDGESSDWFGWSVSISGDYAIIGAYKAGAAYIFKWNGTDWIQESKLTASGGYGDDYFGYAVSISGDYAVIGAYSDDGQGMNTGAAYIFRRFETYWIQQKRLTASNSSAYDYFGISVSISGDYAVIGAYGDDDKGDGAGAAYIFFYNGTDWIQESKLTASDGDTYDNFGYAVSISGDTVVIGAYLDDDKGVESGSVYIFKRDGTDWIQESKLTASDGESWDWFGRSVSIFGDYAVIGAYGDDDNAYRSGAAYGVKIVCTFQ